MILVPCLLQLAGALTGYVDVSVSRTVNAGETEAVFSVTASAPPSVGLAQVAARLEGVGVRAEHLQQVTYSQGLYAFERAASVTYSFELRVPGTRLEALSVAMDNLFSQPPAPLTSFRFSASLNPSAAAIESARLSVLPALFEEARSKAEASFAAAGQTAGPVLSISDRASAGSGMSVSVELTLRVARSGAQASGRSVSATVTRPLTVPFDVASISVGTNTEMAEALLLLAPLGITAADLSSQTSSLTAGGSILFSPAALGFGTNFSVTRPAGEFPRFLDAFSKIAAQSDSKLGLSLNASLTRSDRVRASEREQAMPALLAEARLRAEPLARLLHLPLGLPRTIMDAQSRSSVYAIYASFLLGYVSTPPGDFSSSSGDPSLIVEFAVD